MVGAPVVRKKILLHPVFLWIGMNIENQPGEVGSGLDGESFEGAVKQVAFPVPFPVKEHAIGSKKPEELELQSVANRIIRNELREDSFLRTGGCRFVSISQVGQHILQRPYLDQEVEMIGKQAIGIGLGNRRNIEGIGIEEAVVVFLVKKERLLVVCPVIDVIEGIWHERGQVFVRSSHKKSHPATRGNCGMPAGNPGEKHQEGERQR